VQVGGIEPVLTQKRRKSNSLYEELGGRLEKETQLTESLFRGCESSAKGRETAEEANVKTTDGVE